MFPTMGHQQVFASLEHFPFHWVNQIVTFEQDEEILTKRIVGISKDKSAIFVMGDNRHDSIDSRTFGPIHRLQITGVYLFNIPTISTE